MNDFNISFLAGLDKNRSKENLNQDIDTIKKSLKELELKAKLDPNQIKSLENQLNTLKINLSDVSISQNTLNGLVNQINNSLKEIKISNISVSNDTSKAQQVGQQIGNDITQGLTQELSKSDDVINNFKKSLSNAGKDSSEIDNIVKEIKSLNVQIDSLKFNESTDGLMKIDVSALDKFGNKVKITQSLLQDLQTMEWNVANTTTSVISTKELDKINNAFSDYTAKLAQFKSTNSEILSGLTVPLTDFESKLSGLKNGSSTIDEVANAYKLLNTEVSNITKNFSRQLSPIDSAIRNLVKGEETISGLRAEFKGLNNAPKEINSELNKCAKLLENVKKIESQEGRTENWSQAYRQWSNSVDVLQAKLKMLRKEQSNVASTQIFKISDLKDNDITYMSKVYNTIEKQMVEINRMANTKGWNIIDVSGVEQADGLIKNLTLTITDAEGALKRLTMQREKLQGNGKAQYDGLIQVGDVKVIETARKEQASLTNAMAKGREQANLIKQIEEKRQQMAQNNAINKALEQEYQDRQKNIQATQKQAELDKQNALSFTKSASERLSSAISKYSYGDTSDANAMMKQMNRGLSNFGDLSNVQGNIKQLSSAIDKIIDDLKTSHEQSLQVLNEEIKAEQTLQSQKDAFNKKNINAIDYEIQKRKEESKVFSSMLQAQMQEEQKLAENVNRIAISLGVNGDTTAQIEILRNNFSKLGMSADEVKTKMNSVDTEVQQLKTLMNSGAENSGIISQFNKLKTSLKQTQNNLKQTRSEYNLLATAQQRLSLANDIEAWNQKNTAATKEVIEQNEKYIATLRNLDVEMTKIEKNDINTSFKQNINNMRSLNKLGASLKNQFKDAAESFAQWLSVSSAIMGIVYSMKEAVSELKEVDTLLTEVSKANDQLSKSDLEQIGNDSFDVASKYGKSATDYLAGVQEASRAGYKNANDIAELSVATQGAGDMTAELANQYIIATDKAYKLNGSVSALTEILDGSNKITNENAVSMTDLAEGMSVVGSQAASSQMSVEQTTSAIATLVAVTQQSGSEMGNAFKGILMNLRQVTGEVEDGGNAIDEDSLTKYEEACTKLGVSLSTVKDGVVSLKEPMQIIKELSEEYKKLDESDARRANLLSAVGGKYRANALNAILENYDLYEKMLQDYANGTGSMSIEAEKTAKSWEGSWNRVKNTWVDIVGNVANSDAIITAINGFNSLLSAINKVTDALGSLGTIGLGVGLFAGIKNVGREKCYPSYRICLP